MRKILIAIAAAGAVALPTHEAAASEYGCTVLLCLSNPSGPMAVQQCVPPIQQLYQDLHSKPPKPFPTCEEGAPAVARPAQRPYDNCPDGTTELAEGSPAIMMSAADFANYERSLGPQRGLIGRTVAQPVTLPEQPTYNGIGKGSMNDYQQRKVKTCVSNKLGTAVLGRENVGTDAETPGITVDVYGAVTTIEAARTPNVIDVYIDNKLFNTVRF